MQCHLVASAARITSCHNLDLNVMYMCAPLLLDIHVPARSAAVYVTDSSTALVNTSHITQQTLSSTMRISIYTEDNRISAVTVREIYSHYVPFDSVCLLNAAKLLPDSIDLQHIHRAVFIERVDIDCHQKYPCAEIRDDESAGSQ